MRALTVALLAMPALLAGQTPTPTATGLQPYRGFHPGMSAADFEVRARAITRAGATPLVCNTSTRTAQVMECGVIIRDPDDGAEFYLGGHFVEGRADVVSLKDSGTTELVTRAQREMRSRYGPPHPMGTASWQWRQGAQFIRLTWRARGPMRWISVQLTDTDVMRGITRYLPRDTTKKR